MGRPRWQRRQFKPRDLGEFGLLDAQRPIHYFGNADDQHDVATAGRTLARLPCPPLTGI